MDHDEYHGVPNSVLGMSDGDYIEYVLNMSPFEYWLQQDICADRARKKTTGSAA